MNNIGITLSREELESMIEEIEGSANLPTKAQRLRKAADPLLTTVMNSASLSRELANRFIDLTVEETVLLKMVRVHRTDSSSGDITKLNVSGPITRGAGENSTFSETRRPSDSVVTYTTAKSVSGMDITGEWSEDNIEGQGGINTVVKSFTSAIGNDMETLSIEGDDSVVGADDTSQLLVINDGFHVLTASGTGTHIVGAAAKQFSYKLASDMLRAMPTKWKQNITNLRWMMSWDTAQSYVDEAAARGTAYGDQIRQTGKLPPICGIQPEIVPKIPQDLTLSGTADLNGTFIWLCDPRNLIYVVQRMFKLERERVPRKDREEFTAHMRTDFVIENTDAVVKATNVTVTSSAAYYGA